MVLVVFDYICTECKHIFESFVDKSEKDKALPCPECGKDAFYKPSFPKIDNQGMAMDDAFTSAVGKWENDRYRQMAKEAKCKKEHDTYK